MSGIGRVFRQKWRAPDGSIKVSPYFSISFPYQGKNRREATKATSEAAARAILHQRLNEIGRGKFQPGQDKVYLTDLVELLKAHYDDKDNRSLKDALWKLKAPLEFFAGWTVPMITVEKINAFKRFRRDAGMARATVNGELRYLRLLFHLGEEDRVIAEGSGPVIHLLEGENKRQGFINPGDFENLLSKFDDPDVADLVEWLYRTGWRVNAAKGLEWASIDLNEVTVTMTSALSKNKKPLILPLSVRLMAILNRRREKRRLECPFVFHRDGKRIVDFKKNWARATQAAGFKGLIVHDMCRSMARNLRRMGVDENVASKYMNRSTPMYRLYNVADSEDLRAAGAKLDSYTEKEKVVEIKVKK